MIDLLLIAGSSFIIALSGALVPGPLFTITVSESARKGISAGPLIIFGHGILEFILILLIMAGLSPFLREEGTRTVVSLIGGSVLIVMGLMLVGSAPKARLDFSTKEKNVRFGPVLSGIVGSLSSPYWLIWWVTIGLGYLASSMKYGVAGITAFFAGHISADLLWYSLVSFVVSRGRSLLGTTGYRIILFLCGCFLVSFGVWFISAA